MRHPLFTPNGGSVSIVLIGVLAALLAMLPAAMPPSPAHAQFGQLFVSTNGPYTGSPGFPVSMFAQVSGGFGGAFQYFWSFGDGTQGSGQSVSHVYSVPGTYTVQVSVSSSTGQTGVATTTATIGGGGQFGTQVSAGGPYTGQPGQAIFFTGSAPFGTFGQQYIWNFGDGTSGSGQSVSHVYNIPGTYSVTLSVRNQFGATVGSATTTATIGQGGQFGTQVSAGGPYTGQPGQPIFMTASAPFGVSAQQYLWNFGDGTSGSGQSVSHVYNVPGTYTVTVSVPSAFGGTAGSATTTATIGGGGQFGTQVSAGGPYTGQPGQAIFFTGSAPFGTFGQQYIWNFGDGTSGSGQSVSHVYNVPGTYTVTLQVTGGTGLAGSATTTATIGTGGATTSTGLVSAGGPYTGVPGQPITFYGSAPGVPNATQYTWNFGDGTTGTGQTVTHAYTTAGTYNATLTVSNTTGLTYSGTSTVSVSGTASTIPTTPTTGAPTTVSLVTGCNNIASTWPNETPVTTVAAAVSPASALSAIWRWSASANRYEGFSLTSAAVSDLRTVRLLEPLFFCMSAPGTLSRPAY